MISQQHTPQDYTKNLYDKYLNESKHNVCMNNFTDSWLDDRMKSQSPTYVSPIDLCNNLSSPYDGDWPLSSASKTSLSKLEDIK